MAGTTCSIGHSLLFIEMSIGCSLLIAVFWDAEDFMTPYVGAVVD